jgi:hypothetical protein
LQDEAPQEDKSHMKTLIPKKPSSTIGKPSTDRRFFGISEVLFRRQVRQLASADAASDTPLFTMSKIANAGLC